MEMRFNIKEVLISLFSFILFLLLWQFIAKSGVYNQSLFPPVTVVFKAFIESIASKELFLDVYASLIRIISGFAIGALVGILFGIISGRIKILELSLGRIMHFLSYAPPVALVPLFILWLGIGNSAIIPLIAWSVFFPVWFNTRAGVSNINKEYIRAGEILGSTKIKLWKDIIFHASLPYIITGLRLGIGVAFIMLIVGEMAGTFAGVGYRIELSHLAFRADKMILGVIILGVLGFLMDYLFMKSVKKIAPWTIKDE